MALEYQLSIWMDEVFSCFKCSFYERSDVHLCFQIPYLHRYVDEFRRAQLFPRSCRLQATLSRPPPPATCIKMATLSWPLTVLRTEHRDIKSINQPPYAVCETALSTVGSREVGRVLPTLFIDSARRRVIYQPVSGLKTIMMPMR